MTAPEDTSRLSTPGRWLVAPLVWLVRIYQKWISPMTPPSCRFTPSCSAYALTALRRHGLLRGTWLAVRRILRCHPWNPGGVDHVPASRTAPSSDRACPPDSLTESARSALRNT